MKWISRRTLLKFLAGGAAMLGLRTRTRTVHGSSLSTESVQDQPQRVDGWSKTHDRIWLGGNFWANPMEDWRVVDGAAECGTSGGDRNIHLLTHQLTDPSQPFSMAVRVERAALDGEDGGAGFRIGVTSDINEFRSNCFAKSGIRAGLLNGSLVLGQQTADLQSTVDDNAFRLTLVGRPIQDQCELTLHAEDGRGETLGSVSIRVPAQRLLGNVALVNNFDPMIRKGRGARYRFSEWLVGGRAFAVTPSRRFGPILWSMYSLSDSRSDEGFVLKMSALTGPLGERDRKSVELLIEKVGVWESLGASDLDTDAWVANFRVPRWDASRATPYRLVYRESHADGSESESHWSGVVRANPQDRPLRLAALTCQNDYAFPYEPVAQNVLALDTDMAYFSGDQLYENHGGYGLIREPAEPAILNYLRKFYQFGWAFREVMRDRPTLCIPDDHDVFQGNIWGEGGAPMQDLAGGASSKGGYREPARMVNAVHRTCVSHHPDAFDPTPCKQDISVYYGDMVYGDVSFAVLGDRQWKSGPERVDTGSGRADHVVDPDFDCSVLDQPGLDLLGERQEEFLRHWATGWRGHSIKVLLSQTVFAGVATHHGRFDGYLKADLDSGSWPQTARNRAVEILRDSMALHINGDQHLTTLSQYGVDKQRDSNWSFCTPAIAAGYQRWWRPDEVGIEHRNRPEHGLPHTGEFRDGFGNLVYVYAVGNPEVPSQGTRYERAHQKGSGFGLVTIDPREKTYRIEAYRFLIDVTDGRDSNQFPGWPITLHQAENRGENRLS